MQIEWIQCQILSKPLIKLHIQKQLIPNAPNFKLISISYRFVFIEYQLFLLKAQYLRNLTQTRSRYIWKLLSEQDPAVVWNDPCFHASFNTTMHNNVSQIWKVYLRESWLEPSNIGTWVSSSTNVHCCVKWHTKARVISHNSWILISVTFSNTQF